MNLTAIPTLCVTLREDGVDSVDNLGAKRQSTAGAHADASFLTRLKAIYAGGRTARHSVFRCV